MAKKLYADEIDYRGFTISPCPWEGFTFVSDDYDWAPDGVMGKAGGARTIQDCKEEIDQYYAEGMNYRIERVTPEVRTITKFYFWQEAVEFCRAIGEDVSNIKVYHKNREIQFDTI